MMPILYDEFETEFASNGVGILRDAIDCEVIRSGKSVYELEMVYPVKGIHFSSIAMRSIILAKPDPVTRAQPFRVYRMTKPMKGKVTVYARHVAYDTMGISVARFSAEGIQAAMKAMKENAVGECPFEFYTNKTSTSAMTVKVPTSMWELLGGTEGSLLDTYGGEYEFDRWQIGLYTSLGADRGVSIRYGKNLTDLKQEENCAGCYTEVYPYWTNTEGDYLELPEQVVPVEGNFSYTKTLTKDFSSEWMEKPTEDQLREKTVKYITDNDIGVPEVSLKLAFVALEQTEEYKGKAILERVLWGDTVAVEFTDMGISAKARVNETRYLPILERYKDVSLGSVKSNFADIIVKQGKELDKRPDMTAMEWAIHLLTKAITGAKGGAVRLLDTDGDEMPDTLYIADDPDPAVALKVWRFNYEGWAASKTGYDGPFVMGASFDSGILAEFITAGTLYGMLLKAGRIESEDGKIVIDLTSGDEPVFNTGIQTSGLKIVSDNEDNPVKVFSVDTYEKDDSGKLHAQARYFNSDGQLMCRVAELFDAETYKRTGCRVAVYAPGGTFEVDMDCTDAAATVSLRKGGYVRCVLQANDAQSGVYLQKEDGTTAGGFAMDHSSDDAKLVTARINGKEVAWQDNGDGTCTLVGT